MATENQAQHALREALKVFSQSARYAFLKSLHVGPLLGDDSNTLGEISELTCEELVLLSTEAPDELAHLTAAQERVLTTLLCALSEGEAPRRDDEPSDDTDDPNETQAVKEEPVLNSAQCELDLRERLAKLRIHPDFSQVKDIQLRQFWDSSSPSSPFEELFTINQLMGMDLTVLSKKRSMTGARLLSMTRALDNALLSLEGKFQERGDEPAPQERIYRRVRHDDHPWSAELERFDPLHATVVELFARGVADLTDGLTLFDEAFVRLSSAISAQDFVSVVTGAPLSGSCIKSLQKWLAPMSHDPRFGVLRGALSSPGIHISRVRELVAGGPASSSFYGLGAIVCVRAMGAREVSVGSHVCEGVWSTNPTLVSLLLKEARITRQSVPSKAISAVCSEMDPFLHSWLCKVSKEVVTPVRVSKKGRKGRCRE
jgi:hypothetical protein